MKKIVILAIALLSTGIVFSATILKKQTAQAPVVKIEKNISVNSVNIAADAVSSAD